MDHEIGDTGFVSGNCYMGMQNGGTLDITDDHLPHITFANMFSKCSWGEQETCKQAKEGESICGGPSFPSPLTNTLQTHGKLCAMPTCVVVLVLYHQDKCLISGKITYVA